jgi:hypothetical protein
MELELIISVILLILLGILVARYTELTPYIIFWLISRETRKVDLNYVEPEDLGLVSELVEFHDDKKPIMAWFFPNETEERPSVFMIPNWYHNEDHMNNLKTAAILQKAGYNVFLPVFHWNIEGKIFQKEYISPRACLQIILKSYRYFINRPEIDRRNISIFSSGVGTILASQLIRDYPIKAIVLENGPITLWNELSDYLNQVKKSPFTLTKIMLVFLLFPFIWRTKWQARNVVKKIGACPSFLIGSREDPRKKYWQTYAYMYKPKQFWLEHSLHSQGGVRELWPREYSMQIRSFLDTHFNLIETIPEFHFELKTKRKRKTDI